MTTRRRSGSRSRSRSSTPTCARPTSSISPTPTSSASSTSTASSAARPAATSSACCATCGCRSSRRCTPCSATPSAEQRRVLDQVVDLSARLIVMSERARTFLREIYDVPEAKIDLIAHGIPDMPFVDPDLLQGPVRGRGEVRRADVRAALAQQGHRAHAPGDAGDPQGVPQLRLHRAGGHPPEPDPRAGGALPDQPGAAGQEPGHQAERELLQPVRRDRRADRVHRHGRHLRHALSEPGADHLGHAGLRVRLRQGGGLDALLARRGAAGRRPRGARPLRRLGGAGPGDLRAVPRRDRAGTRCGRRPTCWAGR